MVRHAAQTIYARKLNAKDKHQISILTFLLVTLSVEGNDVPFSVSHG